MKVQGKVVQTEYDQSITAWDAERECCYCLTNGQVRAILGMTEYLGWSARWYSRTNQTIDHDKVEALKDDLIRRLFMGCGENTIILKRVNQTTGRLQQSMDGGVTWTDSPEDPRIGYPAPPAPVTSGLVGTKCDAAGNVVMFARDTTVRVLEAKNSSQNLASFILVVASIIMALFVPGMWFWIPVLLETVVSILFGMSAAQIVIAMSSTTYDEFQCILYCHIEDDGSFTDDDYQGILADIPTKITDTDARKILTGYVKSWQTKGLNLAANYGMRSGDDCSDCDCEGCDVDTWTIDEEVGGTALFIDEDGGGKFIQATTTMNVGLGYHILRITSGSPTACCNYHHRETVSELEPFAVGINECGNSDVYHYWSEPLTWGVVVNGAPGVDEAITVKVYFTAP